MPKEYQPLSLPEAITTSPEISSQMLRQMLEGSPKEQALGNQEGFLIYVNPPLARLLKYEPEDLAGKHWTELVVEEEREKVETETAKRSKGVASTYETRLLTNNGKQVHCEIAATPIIVEGETRFTHVIFTDKTLEVLYAEALESLNQTRSLENVLEIIGEKIRQITSFDSAVLHLVDNEGNIHIHRRWGGLGRLEPMADLGGFTKIKQDTALGEIVETKIPLVIPDTTDPEASWVAENHLEAPKSPTLSYIGIPLLAEGKVIGVLSLNSKTPNMFSVKDLANLTPLAAPIATALERARLFAEIEESARTDLTTGLRIKRGLVPQIEQQIERTNRSGRPFSVLFLDIDRFKNFNDAFDHMEGDKRLQQIGEILKQIRGVDSAFKFGGEEFVLLLEDCDEGAAFKIALRLQENMHLLPDKINGNPIPIIPQTGLPAASSFSIGITTVHKDDPKIIDAFIGTADKSMYRAKEGGRNCVGIHLPKVTVEPKAGVRIERFEQVVVVKPRTTDHLSRRIQVTDLYVEIVPSYWEIEVVRPKLTTDLEEDKISYESFVKYSVFTTEPNWQGTRNIYIYRKTEVEEVDNYPVATLSFGPGNWHFDGEYDYHQALESGQQPEDSFAWINILFPLKEAFPEQDEQFLI